MRIQHNIAAMNAYRNYNTNTSALSKNLEKLSSGYKINRAGDDAAGLAISEKMRAQITGLNAAQKNVKDGISLVKTAEGAMQEIQDMLNRMDYLATQSANGTYQDEVDRENLMKEVNALKTEINRIADSANFNGIKLLDGSLDTSAVPGVKYTEVKETEDVLKLFKKDDFTGTNQTDADNDKNILETEGTGASKASFQISLDNIGSVKVAAGEAFTLKIGTEDITLTAETTDKTYTAKELATALNGKTVTLTGADGTTTGDFTITADGELLKFTSDDEIQINNQAKVTWEVTTAPAGGNLENGIQSHAEEAGTVTGTGSSKTGVGGTPGTKASGTLAALTTASTTAGDTTDCFDVTIGGVLVKADKNSDTTVKAQADAWAASFNAKMTAAAAEGSDPAWTASVDNSGAITLTSATKTAFAENSSDDGLAAMISDIAGTISGFTVTAGSSNGQAAVTNADGSSAATIVIKEAASAASTATSDKVKVTFGNKAYEVDYTNTTKEQQAAAWAEAFNADSTYNGSYVATKQDDGSVKIEAKTEGQDQTAPSGITFPSSGQTGEWADGTDATGATVTVNKGVDLAAALDAVEGETGSINVKYDSANSKWVVSTGSKTIEATGTFASNALTLTTSDGKELLRLSADSNVTENDIKTAYGDLTPTGLTYTAPGGGGEELETDIESDEVGDTLGIDWDNDAADIGSNADNIKALSFTITDATQNITVSLGDLDIADNDSVKDVAAKILAKAQAAVDTWNTANSETAGYKYGNVRVVTGADPGTVIAPQAAGDGLRLRVDQLSLDDETSAGKSGYINTGIQNPVDFNDGASAQVARGTVDFSDAFSDGSKIKIGDTTYTVALGKDSKFKNAENVVNLTDIEAGSTDLEKIAAQRLAEAAADNSIFTVGHKGDGLTTLQQKTAVKDSTDMTTKEKFASYLGMSVADAASVASAQPGKGLTLQIGDTSDAFNQMSVNVGDMHTTGMGIADVDIGTQAGAQAAVQTIKDAINYVSSVRGDLGAIQNRLEHTGNNLSVMAENIQDAESTIRDTDVAEEMMSYVKNNILVQSAQAMLAQANQLPQGVLQLLG